MTSSPRRVFTIRATSGSARLPEDFLYWCACRGNGRHYTIVSPAAARIRVVDLRDMLTKSARHYTSTTFPIRAGMIG
jgi:hypothetical protein